MPNNDLEKGVLRYFDAMLDKAPYDKTVGGVIKDSTASGYTVTIGNTDYTNVPTTSSTSHSVNDTVKVMIPQGQYNNMFILGKVKLV